MNDIHTSAEDKFCSVDGKGRYFFLNRNRLLPMAQNRTKSARFDAMTLDSLTLIDAKVEPAVEPAPPKRLRGEGARVLESESVCTHTAAQSPGLSSGPTSTTRRGEGGGGDSGVVSRPACLLSAHFRDKIPIE